jgi:hypothetical protein
MIVSAVVLGLLTAYYFGLRAGAWAAGLTAAACVVAMVVPRLELTIHLALAVAAVGIHFFGKRRARPAQSVLAMRAARRAVKSVRERIFGRRD